MQTANLKNSSCETWPSLGAAEIQSLDGVIIDAAKRAQGSAGAKVLWLIGSIKALNYPDIISAAGAYSSSFPDLLPLTLGTLSRFTHSDMMNPNCQCYRYCRPQLSVRTPPCMF